jgi:hypothetical protein
MVKRKYLLFLEALLVAVFLFSFGILSGIFIENARASKIQQNFALLETDVLDTRLISDLIGASECSVAIAKNIEFADRVFNEAKLLDKYEQSSEISDSIKQQHMKYDLLRVMIWMNSIKIRERCNASYHNIVYIYRYKNPSLAERARQTVISNLLSDIKGKYGDSILLISFSGDTGLPSVDIVKSRYNISELPVVIIDEKIKITDIKGAEEIERYIT